jgi:hypothetical protein
MERRAGNHLHVSILVISLVLVGLLPTAGRSVAQQPTLKDQIYASPNWGYSIRWHADEWTVSQETSEGRADLLELTDSLGNVIVFTGREEFNGDAAACLDDMISELLAIPGATDPITVSYDGGDPVERRHSQQSYTLMQVRLPAAGVPTDFAVYAECQMLEPGVAIFARFYIGPVAVFDQWYDDVVATLESVFLPIDAWQPISADDYNLVWAGEAPLLGLDRLDAALFPYEAFNPRLLVGLVDAAGDARVIAFENFGSEPITVEPVNIALTLTSLTGEGGDQIERPYAIFWEDGITTNADGSRVLAPGERATVRVEIAPVDESAVGCDELPYLTYEYRLSADEYAEFAAKDITACFTDADGTPFSLPRPVLQLNR